MKARTLLLGFYGILAAMPFQSQADEVQEVDKRYLAALAKNGRLPKFVNAQKKDQSGESPQDTEPIDDNEKDSFAEDKRHIGAFLKTHGKPSFMSGRADEIQEVDKRYLAALAKNGRLTKFANAQKKDLSGESPQDAEPIDDNEKDSLVEDKRHIGAFLKTHGKPSFMSSRADEIQEVDKRYLAALAKNGRLPKFASAQKKDRSGESPQDGEPVDDNEKDLFVEDKRHIGAFLKSHGKPSFMSSGRSGGIDNDASNQEDKRNVATLARLGRLNAVRYGRYHPYNTNGKRISNIEVSNNDEDNEINVLDDNDCYDATDEGENEQRPNSIQKKRYVAALARSGRLPIWHSQRMWWGGKRDDYSRYLSSSSDENGGKSENAIDGLAFVAPKNKRCKKVYDYQKRNVAALARNGKLPFRSNV